MNWGSMCGKLLIGGKNEMEIRFELKSSCFDTMINYLLFQKCKLMRNCEFYHLIVLLFFFI